MTRGDAKVEVWITDAGPVRAELYRYGVGRVRRIAGHAHGDFQFGHSPTGSGGFRIGRRWHDTVPGRVHCVPPHVEHATGADGVLDRPADYLMAYVDPAYLARLVGEDVRGGGARPYSSTPDPRAGRIMHRLVAGRADEAGTDELALGLLECLNLSPLGPQAGGSALASTARDYLMADPSRSVSLRELGDACGASAGRVRGAFKAAYGVPPHRFVLMERLRRARVLLADGLDPAAAALGLGFADQSHLTRLMRRYFGHTPGSVAGPPAHFVQDGA
jgi:AraC-like DNA-binding protein